MKSDDMIFISSILKIIASDKFEIIIFSDEENENENKNDNDD